MKPTAFLSVPLILLTNSVVCAAPLHDRGTSADTRNNFGAGSDSDTDPTHSSASIQLANGENGSASASYSGDVGVRADSSTDSGGPGNGILSNATRATHYHLRSDTLPDDTQVTGQVSIRLHGRIQNIGNNSYGGGEISLNVDLRQEKTGPDETRNLFSGAHWWNMGSSGIPSSNTGFANYGSITTDIITGDPVLFFSYTTSISFTGLVGDRISVQYRLRALSAGTTRVNFSNTGDFEITFADPQVRADVIPAVTTPDERLLTATSSGGQVHLSWEGGPGIIVQRSPSLSSPAWTEVAGSEGLSEFDLPIVGTHEFFRLVIP